MPFSFDFGGGFNPAGGFHTNGGFNPGGSAGEGFTPPPKRPRKPRKAIGSAFTRTLINLG